MDETSIWCPCNVCWHIHHLQERVAMILRRYICLAFAILLALIAVQSGAQDRTGAIHALHQLDPSQGSVRPEVLPPDGRPWIVFVFKACCSPADQAADWVVEAHETWGNRAGIVGLNVDRTRTVQRVRGWLATQHIDFPVLWDPTGEVARAWGVIAPPSVILLDSTCTETYRTMGFIPSYNTTLDEKLTSLFEQSSAGTTP
jgi:hypothetical protein